MIIKYRKKISWNISSVDWIIAFAFVFIMLYYSYNTTLGDSSGFDSTFYLNLISTNIKANRLNTVDLYYGGYISGQSTQYTFQSYYYFASCFTYLAVRLLSHFTIVNNYSVIIWVFQILFNFFFASIAINATNQICKDKQCFKYVFMYIFLFFLGKIYWNNVFGFYGNSYRTIAIAYSIMTLYDLFKEDAKENWLLFAICCLSACAFSSSGVFTVVFLLFGVFFVMVKTHMGIFKYYALIIFLPLINLACVTVKLPLYIIFGVVLVACVMLYMLNEHLVALFNKKYVLRILLILSFTLTFLLSLKLTGNIFDFSAFFDNYSEKADMTISYFNNYRFLGGYNEITYRTLVLVLLVYSVIFEHDNELVKSFIIIFMVFFSPFNCPIMNRLNIVYYRALDIIVNPYTILLLTNMIFDRLNNKYIYYVSLSALLLIFVMNTDFKEPLYYHETCIPSADYNPLMKMSNDDFDVLNRLKEEVDYLNEEKCLVTANLFAESMMPNQRYIYSRTLKINENWSEAERQVYAIFYPLDYLGNGSPIIKPDFDNVAKYLKEAGIDYLVMDKKLDYYNKNTESWEYLIYTVAECGYGYSIYSNDSYELFCFDYE